MTVLVTGASGLVGSHVVEALVARGETVRALVRPASRAAALRLGAEAVAGDVTDPAVWQRAAHGVRAIVHAAAIVQRRGPRGGGCGGHRAGPPPPPGPGPGARRAVGPSPSRAGG